MNYIKFNIGVFRLKAFFKTKKMLFESPVVSDDFFKDNLVVMLGERKRFEQEFKILKRYDFLSKVLYRYKIYNEEKKIIAALILEKNQVDLNKKINIVLQYILNNKEVKWYRTSFYSPFLNFVIKNKYVNPTTLANLLLIFPNEHFETVGIGVNTKTNLIKLLEYKTILNIEKRISNRKKLVFMNKSEYLHFLNCIIYLDRRIGQHKVIWSILKRYFEKHFNEFNIADLVRIFNLYVINDKVDKKYMDKILTRFDQLLDTTDIMENATAEQMSLFILNLKAIGKEYDIQKLIRFLTHFSEKTAAQSVLNLLNHNNIPYTKLNSNEVLLLPVLGLVIKETKYKYLILREVVNSLYQLNELPCRFYNIKIFCTVYQGLNKYTDKTLNSCVKIVQKHIKRLILYNLETLINNIKKDNISNPNELYKLRQALISTFIKVFDKEDSQRIHLLKLVKENIHIICPKYQQLQEIQLINKHILQTDDLYSYTIENLKI
jgi:hypothetical protein